MSYAGAREQDRGDRLQGGQVLAPLELAVHVPGVQAECLSGVLLMHRAHPPVGGGGPVVAGDDQGRYAVEAGDVGADGAQADHPGELDAGRLGVDDIAEYRVRFWTELDDVGRRWADGGHATT